MSHEEFQTWAVKTLRERFSPLPVRAEWDGAGYHLHFELTLPAPHPPIARNWSLLPQKFNQDHLEHLIAQVLEELTDLGVRVAS